MNVCLLGHTMYVLYIHRVFAFSRFCQFQAMCGTVFSSTLSFVLIFMFAGSFFHRFSLSHSNRFSSLSSHTYIYSIHTFTPSHWYLCVCFCCFVYKSLYGQSVYIFFVLFIHPLVRRGKYISYFRVHYTQEYDYIWNGLHIT